MAMSCSAKQSISILSRCAADINSLLPVGTVAAFFYSLMVTVARTLKGLTTPPSDT
jgi:hypothetical protein